MFFKKFIPLFAFLFCFCLIEAALPAKKILHLTFHKGCKKEIESVAKALNCEVETWFIPGLPPYFFDGTTRGNALYNIGHERAQRIWDLHKEYFEGFDLIITSDTAPLSRIFLQNGFKKPLVIWICNRFDYCDTASLDCNFPDKEYYDLFRQALHQDNVKIVSYTAYERYYAKSKGVDVGSLLITPCALGLDTGLSASSIPEGIVKPETCFLPPYHNETQFMDFSSLLTKKSIPNYCGRYNGPLDLYDFKAIVHLPYAWSNLALFENMALGIPYFIPSKKFFKTLSSQPNYFFPNLPLPIKNDLYTLSEWYSKEHEEIFTFFDSWDDLKTKLKTTNLPSLRQKIRDHAYKHKRTMLSRWQTVLSLPTDDDPYVIGDLMGQFGNQLFIIAATTSLTLDHGAKPLFPGFHNPISSDPTFKLSHNYETLFPHLDATDPFNDEEFLYLENEFNYQPIPFQPNMRIRGWFQSEKYFAHHKDEILDLFAPRPSTIEYLQSHYSDILDHPQTVAIHVRKYSEKENPKQGIYYDCDMEYYEKAMALFPDDALFLIFSNQMDWCKEHFSKLNRSIRFIEGESFQNDFYLMSLCKHNIICNSTFSWWAAYLNRNLDKKIIVPPLWFNPLYIKNPKDLIPKDWIILDTQGVL